MPEKESSSASVGSAPILAAVLAAGSIGGLGGHTIASGSEETLVNASTLESCLEFVRHGREHERNACELDKIKLLLECGK